MAAKDISDACIKLGNIAEKVNEMTSDSGEVEVNDRKIRYNVKGHFYRWKFVWDSEVRDIQTGTTVESTGWKSRSGALDHGLKDLMKKLGE